MFLFKHLISICWACVHFLIYLNFLLLRYIYIFFFLSYANSPHIEENIALQRLYKLRKLHLRHIVNEI